MQTIDFNSLTKPLPHNVVDIEQNYANQTSSNKPSRLGRVLNIKHIFMFLGVVYGLLWIRDGQYVAGIFIVVIGFVLGKIFKNASDKQMVQWYRMRTFAADNNMQFVRNITEPLERSGMIFDIGHSRLLAEAYKLPNRTMIGNYTFVRGGGKNRREYNYGFLEIPLPRKLPHMLLDAKANNLFGISNLPATFSGDQKMQLEGDFNKYFDLYVPKEYGRDALYVFTPDVMQLAIEHGNMYDIEIVEDKMYLYCSGKFSLHDQSELEEIFRKLAALSSKFNRQVDYYADERVADRQLNQVAEQGMRLQKGIPWKIVIVVGVIILFYFVSTIAPYLITIFLT